MLVAWEISLKTVAFDFMSMYSDGYLQQAIDSGADERLMEAKKKSKILGHVCEPIDPISYDDDGKLFLWAC